jgi:alpha-amylase
VGDKFRKLGTQVIADLNPNGPAGHQFSPSAWGLIPSDKAVIFLQNHDTQHDCGLSYRDAQTFRLANTWMLAQPYGYPLILSSFAFVCPAGNSTGPPSDAQGWTTHVACAASLETAAIGQFVCEHRDPYLLRMVRFRKVVAGTAVTQWWDNGANAIAFSRGDKGFVAINRESASVSASVATGLAAGTYCDRISGGKVNGACAGTSIVVAAGGAVQLTLPTNSAIAIDVETKL